ncbi:hypothetical protein QVD17_32057 [Tagetes erecta]|uniref:Uncharacterized protein n=1 Tax=Tagetes erecta TaxID=13708 RepID=A0AAD8K4X0_TARER|nr:hypothetical protein QVD17_32046 [Tagetes erecta]KAK1416260.1 hypothetical protein QVD17_32049 [Tagetes erecta]KAK1416265.1 hypothetical protein QVD17_32054 [Tagetes erecta]KAK1416268.1 hypothetical protein QVD17_32057 [Tagetes erecta]
MVYDHAAIQLRGPADALRISAASAEATEEIIACHKQKTGETFAGINRTFDLFRLISTVAEALSLIATTKATTLHQAANHHHPPPSID